MPRSTRSSSRIDTEALKRDRPLEDVVASYGIVLRRESAGTYRALCPFHQEHTPSFWIDARDASSSHYYCFGCMSHGDVVTFVMERANCSFQEACERLSTGGRPPALDPAARLAVRPAGRKWEELSAEGVEARTLESALQIYERDLWQSARAQAYLSRRAVSESLARGQRLGYATGHALLDWLNATQTPEAESLAVAVQLGLVLEPPGSPAERPAYREFFQDRLIVPGKLRQGRPIWYIGRAVEDEDPSLAIHVGGPPASTVKPQPPASAAGSIRRPRPKYLGLPGEKPLMGLEQVRGRHAAFLVEGPFDLLAAIGWGLPSLAICGTHFPRERLPALAEAVAIYGVFDPDRAGQGAAERFAPLFGSRWRPVRLPNNLDLAELAALGAAGREAFDILVGRARAAAWQQSRV